MKCFTYNCINFLMLYLLLSKSTRKYIYKTKKKVKVPKCEYLVSSLIPHSLFFIQTFLGNYETLDTLWVVASRSQRRRSLLSQQPTLLVWLSERAEYRSIRLKEFRRIYTMLYLNFKIVVIIIKRKWIAVLRGMSNSVTSTND